MANNKNNQQKNKGKPQYGNRYGGKSNQKGGKPQKKQKPEQPRQQAPVVVEQPQIVVPLPATPIIEEREPTMFEKLDFAMAPVNEDEFAQAIENGKAQRNFTEPVHLMQDTDKPAEKTPEDTANTQPAVTLEQRKDDFTLSIRNQCKTEYVEGERVDTTGLVLYGNGRGFVGQVLDYEYSPIGKLTPKHKEIVFYARGVSIRLPIRVTEAPVVEEEVDDTKLPGFYPGTKGLRWTDED